MRISDAQARTRREIYRRQHRWCWHICRERAIWTVCNVGPAIVDHVARGRRIDAFEAQQNYYPLCDFPRGDHHLGWKHAGDPRSPGEASYVLDQFAVKYLTGEASLDYICVLMQGRPWVRLAPSPSDTLPALIVYRAAEILDHGIKKEDFKKERRHDTIVGSNQ